MAAHLDPAAWKKKRDTIIIVCLAIVLLAGAGLATWLLLRDRIIPGKKYAQAEEALQNGNVAEAIEIFTSIGTYRDANDRAAEIAFSMQTDTAQAAALKAAKPGDYVRFGPYEQDNDPNNGPEPITWLVLTERDGRLLLWATDVLENAPYNNEQCNTTWEDCSLRTFLNGPFGDSAFTEAERLLIPKTKMKNKGNSASMTKGGNDTEDYVRILAFDELLEYCVGNPSIETLAAWPSAYAIAKGVETHAQYGTCKWWMRTPGLDQSNATYCDMVGQPFYTCKVSNNGVGVRPMIWVLTEKSGE